jgi:excisionase family DNA binding protein
MHTDEMSIRSCPEELSSAAAAEILNVSRPFLISLLDAGQISYRMVGAHRRVKAASLVRYLREDDARRMAAADELAAEAHALGLS